MFLSRQPDAPEETNAAPLTVDIKTPGHFRGPEDAVVTLVEFGDYQCPSCAAHHPFVKEILNRYPKQVRLEFHHFPLMSIHPNSMAASKAAEAAGEQGHYWEMHDALFSIKLMGYAARSGSRFSRRCRRIGINGTILVKRWNCRVSRTVLKDFEQGDRARVQAVPTFFINGHRYRSG